MNKAKVYIETTIPSYVTSRLSRDIVIAAQQQLTIEWWDTARSDYDLFISELVVVECEQGDKELAKRRMELIRDIAVLPFSNEVKELAQIYYSLLGIPEKSRLDAFHLAVAVSNEIDYLLTWNCKHMAHGEIRMKIHNYNKQNNLFEPMILTPYELMRRD